MAKALTTTLTLALAIAVTVDNQWTLKIRDYDFRASYAIFICLAFTLLMGRGHKFSWQIKTSPAFAKRFYYAGVTLLGLGGALGALGAWNERSLLFYVWTMGTIASLPIVATNLTDEQPHLVRQTWVLLLGAISTVCIVDAVSCYLGFHSGFIGRVASPMDACRPHAWYQEPNYLGGFLLLAVPLCLRLKSTITLALVTAAAVLTTSRAAWAGLLLGSAVTLVWTLLSSQRRLLRRLLVSLGTAVGSLAVLISVHHDFREFVLISFRPKSDLSVQERALASHAALSVWLLSPIIGVGPGQAGRVFIEQISDHPYRQRLDPELQRRVPLSKDLLTEMLSEWGVLGLSGLLLLVIGVAASLPPLDRIWFIVAYGVLLASSQTIARFDLWWVIAALIAPVGPTPKKGIS